jgi:hypothetical protein
MTNIELMIIALTDALTDILAPDQADDLLHLLNSYLNAQGSRNSEVSNQNECSLNEDKS